MYTIYDYIKYYKNTSMEEMSWNIVDNLLCSILAYMHVDPFKEDLSLNELCERILASELEPDTWLMAPKVKIVAKGLMNSKRYKDLVISNFFKEVSERTQFGAVTFKCGRVKVLAFEGSDGTVIGWKENLRLSYTYPVVSQTMAVDYLNEAVEANDDEIYLVGHSKGGNLAMCACYEANDEVYKKIKGIYNFDGPGFLREQYDTPKFVRMQKKLTNVVPEGSYIGVLMYNNSKYLTVNSCETGALIHYPTSWEVFGSVLPKSTMTSRSKYIYTITTKGFDELNREQTKKVVEAIFKDNFSSYNAKMRMNARQVKKAIVNAKAVDVGVLKIMKEFFDVLTVEPIIKNKVKAITKRKKKEEKIVEIA